MLEELKGKGRTVLAARTNRGTFELLQYADESWAIRLDGRIVSMWEHDEGEDCIKTLSQLTGLDKGESCVLVRVSAGTLTVQCRSDVAYPN